MMTPRVKMQISISAGILLATVLYLVGNNIRNKELQLSHIRKNNSNKICFTSKATLATNLVVWENFFTNEAHYTLKYNFNYMTAETSSTPCDSFDFIPPGIRIDGWMYQCVLSHTRLRSMFVSNNLHRYEFEAITITSSSIE